MNRIFLNLLHKSRTGPAVLHAQAMAWSLSCPRLRKAETAQIHRMATCSGPAVSGSALDTGTVGIKTFTVESTDAAGNHATLTRSYSVQYATGIACMGGPGHAILQPINEDGSSVFKQKSTVPAKFRVCDARGESMSIGEVVSSFRLVQKSLGTLTEVDEMVVSTTPDTSFRWDPSGQQWIFNIGTKNLISNATYYYRITLNDSTTIDCRFGLK